MGVVSWARWERNTVRVVGEIMESEDLSIF